jgi:hypothetical protein
LFFWHSGCLYRAYSPYKIRGTCTVTATKAAADSNSRFHQLPLPRYLRCSNYFGLANQSCSPCHHQFDCYYRWLWNRRHHVHRCLFWHSGLFASGTHLTATTAWNMYCHGNEGKW